MPPATAPVPVLVLDGLISALAAIDGGSNYYHAAAFVGIGRDITAQQPVAYPAIFVGEPGEVGNFIWNDKAEVLFHGTWQWDIPIFGVIRDVGMGDEAYRSLLKLAADIFRAVSTDHTLGGKSYEVEVKGWTILGPQAKTDGRPWVGVPVRVKFRTRDNEMVTNPG